MEVAEANVWNLTLPIDFLENVHFIAMTVRALIVALIAPHLSEQSSWFQCQNVSVSSQNNLKYDAMPYEAFSN